MRLWHTHATVSTRSQALLALALCACAPEPAAPPFPLESVALPAIVALEAEVVRDVRAEAPPVPDLEERVRGLVFDLPGARGAMRTLQLGQISELGDPSVPVLAAVLSDPRTADGPRAAAVDALAAIDSPRAAGHVAAQVEGASQAWLRAHAARALANTRQDQVVPRLLLRLKYETDPASVIELATTLAHFENHAGLDGLFALRHSSTSEASALAIERLAQVAAAAGVADGETLWRLWNTGDSDGRLKAEVPSTRHRLEIWRRIALLSEHDPRTVDDARFVLARTGAWVVEPLCRALHDVDVNTRVHAAQCLQSMGARATGAGPTLLAALGEPSLAPAAALALGAIAYPACVGELSRRVERGFDPTLRVAAAQALGPLNLSAGIEPLTRAIAPDEPIDLRQAAAQSLLRLGRAAGAVELLVECLTLPGADAGAAESALDTWIGKLDTPAAQNVRASWNALAGPPHTTPTADAVAERQRARAELLEAELPRLARRLR